MARQDGFSLIELIITLAILATLAMITVPIAEVMLQRERERELRVALREVRTAIDNYKIAADSGRVEKPLGSSGYPKSLDVLVDGVEDLRNPTRSKIYFLRRVPRDPISSASAATPTDSWGLRSYRSEATDPKAGDDVYDVYSRSTKAGLNGVPYRQW